MDEKSVLKKYRARLVTEAVVKSFLCGLIIGFAATFVFEITAWLMDFHAFWIGFVILAVITSAVTPLFYFLKYKPSDKDVARRVDRLGLEERLITMHEFKDTDSYIAQRQRQDAIESLETINASLLKFAISIPLIVTLVISAIFGAGMTTVTALSAAGVIEGGSKYIDPIINPDPEKELRQFEVVYDVVGEGSIEGDEFQVVIEGGNATGVLAVADDGWVFVMWTDGSENPYREDVEVLEDINVSAVFFEGDEGDGDGDGEDGEGNGDDDSDKPGDGDGNGNGSGESEQSSDGQGGGAGGQYEEVNQVIDGNTYYGGSTYDNALEESNEQLAEGNDSAEEKGVKSDYMRAIED